MRIIYIILFFIIPFGNIMGQDDQNPEYNGYRVFLSDAKIIKEKKSNFKVQFKITNTGSKTLNTETKSEYEESLVIKSDDILGQVGKSAFEDLLFSKIRSGKFNLSSGQSQTVLMKVKIPKDRRGDDDGFDVRLGKGGRKDYSRDLCPDLIVDSLVLVKKDHKNAYVEFQVKNIGKGAINIIGEEKNKLDNIAVGAFFSGTKKYSSGDLLAGQVYLNGLKESKGILFPGQVMKARMKISRKKQSKYTKVLIIVVDSQGVVIECNEGNNYKDVLLR